MSNIDKGKAISVETSEQSSSDHPPSPPSPVEVEGGSEPILNESVGEIASTIEKKGKRQRSEIWNHFTQISVNEKGKIDHNNHCDAKIPPQYPYLHRNTGGYKQKGELYSSVG